MLWLVGTVNFGVMILLIICVPLCFYNLVHYQDYTIVMIMSDRKWLILYGYNGTLVLVWRPMGKRGRIFPFPFRLYFKLNLIYCKVETLGGSFLADV